MSQFADVILPLPLYKYFTYRIPDDMRSCLQQGSRVVVPFGRKKYYTAIVAYLHDLAPVGYETKEIISLLDDKPVLRRPQLRFWEWIAEYYLCSVGDVYKAALPSGLKLESETTVTLNGEYEESEEVRLKDRELILLDTLSRNGKMSLLELERETGLKIFFRWSGACWRKKLYSSRNKSKIIINRKPRFMCVCLFLPKRKIY